MKLWEGNAITSVCHSVQGGWVSQRGYPWEDGWVCPRRGRGIWGVCPEGWVWPWGGYHRGGIHHYQSQVLTPSGSHQNPWLASMWYTSYWNAFLFDNDNSCIQPYMSITKILIFSSFAMFLESIISVCKCLVECEVLRIPETFSCQRAWQQKSVE